MEKTAQKNSGSGIYPVFISIVFWIAAGLGLYGTLPLAVYVFMGMLLVCNISIILSTFYWISFILLIYRKILKIWNILI